ncbi:hypothetical protein V8F06_014951 [Rhypophila decipiens]
MEERPLESVPERGANGPRAISDPGEQGQIQQPQGSRKRQTPLENEQRRTKRVRTAVHLESGGDDQSGDLASILRSLDEEFAEKERLSEDRF